MCARYTIRTPADLLAARFGLPQVPDLRPRFNISPAQAIPVIGTRAGGHGRGLAMFKWGFVPHWVQDTPKMRPVNAKAETVAQSPLFGDSFRARRCLMPADGFYKKKFPVWFHLKDNQPFAFAGI
jgi:putative SOS response-associated peptidase YedK